MTTLFDPATFVLLQTVGLASLTVVGAAVALLALPWTDREISDVHSAARSLVQPTHRLHPAEG